MVDRFEGLPSLLGSEGVAEASDHSPPMETQSETLWQQHETLYHLPGSRALRSPSIANPGLIQLAVHST